MRLLLTGQRCLEVRQDNHDGPVPDGEALLRVLYCAVCKTDAKMWERGHRDLTLPRVPGHEIAAADSLGRCYVVWPGVCCDDCEYCRSGRENLCPNMKIIGFHRDGGFADRLVAPKTNLIPVPESVPPVMACLAEPVGCVIHALEKCRLGQGRRVLIYGAGTMGLLTALAAAEYGAEPLIIEINPAKIKVAAHFLRQAGLTCLASAPRAVYDTIVNACPDPAAFRQGLTMVAGGGCFCFFSGLVGKVDLTVDQLNLVHYREATVVGAYGLTRANMRQALSMLDSRQSLIELLIAEIVPPDRAPALMEKVLAGRGFKYVLDFTADR